MSDPAFISKTQQVSKTITDSIAPIMQAVKNFSDSIKPFLDLKTGKGKNTEDYICLKPGKMTEITTNIAGAFNTFIRILSNELSSDPERYKDISSAANEVNKVLSIIKKSVTSLSAIIKQMKDENGNVFSVKDETITNFTKTISKLINYFSSPNVVYDDVIENAGSCKRLLETINGSMKYYTNIISTLRNISADNDTKSIVSKFISNLDILTNAKYNSNIENASSTIVLYSNSLVTFSSTLINVTDSVYTFVTGLDTAKTALETLDDILIGKANERNKALETLAEKISDIGDAVDKLSSAFERLDENAIINKFSNIKALLETVNTKVEQSNNTGSENNNTSKANKNNNTGNVSNTTNNYTNSVPPSGRVVFEFKNVKLDGFYHI